jgi:hypothetical protein
VISVFQLCASKSVGNLGPQVSRPAPGGSG